MESLVKWWGVDRLYEEDSRSVSCRLRGPRSHVKLRTQNTNRSYVNNFCTHAVVSCPPPPHPPPTHGKIQFQQPFITELDGIVCIQYIKLSITLLYFFWAKWSIISDDRSKSLLFDCFSMCKIENWSGDIGPFYFSVRCM